MTATPTADIQNMIAPGQEGVVDQFFEDLQQQNAAIAEAEAAQQGEQEEPQLLAGKFKSTEDLEKAYQELQRKLGQRGQDPAAEDSSVADEPAGPTPEQYTPELGKQLYGDTVATAIEAAEINPLEMAQKVQAGEDVSAYVDALVEKGGLPREVVQTYLDGVKPQQPPAAAAQAAALSDADVAELKAVVGGEEQFQQLSQWAMANFDKEELADYNAAVNSSKAAARFALKQLQARASATSSEGLKEPQLIGGGTPVKTDVFETQQQAIEAMRKTNSQGKRLYNSDPKYRAWYEKTLARSNFAA